MATLGASRSLADKEKQALSHILASPPQKKQAGSPQSGHQPENSKIYIIGLIDLPNLLSG